MFTPICCGKKEEFCTCDDGAIYVIPKGLVTKDGSTYYRQAPEQKYKYDNYNWDMIDYYEGKPVVRKSNFPMVGLHEEPSDPEFLDSVGYELEDDYYFFKEAV